MLLLMASTAVPTYAQAQTIQVETVAVTMVYEGLRVTAKRYDILRGRQHLIRIEAEVEVEGRRITIKSEPYSVSKLYSAVFYSSSSSLPTYWWDGIKFVRAPGSSTTWVKYDHPDNYNTYYPNEINREYYLKGYSKTHNHVPRYLLEEAKAKTSFVGIAALLAGVIAALLAVPELVSKIVAAILGLIAAILSLVGFVLYWFINDVIQTELGDGWIWTWGYGKWEFWGWVVAAWWWMSFGAWRDWVFFVII